MQPSVLTISRGRGAHLSNVVRGLLQSEVPPAELVIGVMDEQPYEDLPAAPFPIRQILVPGEELPLAEARNAVAREAMGEALIFVDVDCIPAPSLIGDYLAGLAAWPGLLMGEVLYLPKGAVAEAWEFARLAEIGERHSDRRGPPPEGIVACNDYRCFWSLNFAISRALFFDVGGFDEAYRGYGGEDTDFGRMLDEAEVPIGWIRGARVYHQYHPHHMPPVHHLDSILRNTEVFRAKWGEHTMNHWLRAFRLLGLIAREGEGWRKLRDAGPADLAMTRQTEDMPYANSARVIRMIEAGMANPNAPASGPAANLSASTLRSA